MIRGTGLSSLSFFFFFFVSLALFIFNLFYCFLLHSLGFRWYTQAFSSWGKWEAVRSLQHTGLSLWWLFLLQNMGSRAQGLQQLWPTGSTPSLLCIWISSWSNIIWHHLLKTLFFHHWMILTSLLKINWSPMYEFVSGLWILYVSPYASTTLSWLLQLCNKFWN